MIQIDLATLVKRLNPFAKQALEMAASECMSQQAIEITVAHVLLQMLAIPRNDVRVIAERTGISAEDLRQALTVESYPGGRSAEGYPSFSPMLIEWLKESWLLASAQMQHSELRSGVLLLTLLHSPLRYIPPAAARLLTAINRDQLQQDFAAWTKESAESVDLAGGQTPRATETGDTLLARYAKNMTADARNGRLDPVLCRDYEIDLMIDILCRRRKNNPVVVGDAGVGKSALIEGLALRIVAGLVPEPAGRAGYIQPAQTSAGARRAENHRRHHLERVQKIFRERCSFVAPLPVSEGQRTQRCRSHHYSARFVGGL